MNVDVRLYILAGTFALMVISLITVVIVGVRVRRRERSVSLESLPPVPPPRFDAMSPVDVDLKGLEVPVPENSVQAALLKPLEDRPVWDDAPAQAEYRVASSATAVATPEKDLARRDAPAVATESAPDVLPAEDRSAEATPPLPELQEGRGRIPQIGDQGEIRRLPSAEEILASLEAEMAKHQDEQHVSPAALAEQAPASAPPAIGSPSASEEHTSLPREADSVSLVMAVDQDRQDRPGQRTASGAGTPAEQLQWKPIGTTAELPTAAANTAAGAATSTPVPEVRAAEQLYREATPEDIEETAGLHDSAATREETAEPPAESPAPLAKSASELAEPADNVADPSGEGRETTLTTAREASAAPERPIAVVRAAEPPAPRPIHPEPAAPRPAVRVAGIRVPLAPEMQDASQGEPSAATDDVPEIELSSPVEMWFGEHRIGVRTGTPTFNRLQRYAETLLDDLRSARQDS